jgi:MraZ protein
MDNEEKIIAAENTAEDDLFSGAMNLIGNYRHTMDAKGRVFIPAKFRETVGNAVYMTKGSDHCVFVFSEKRWYDFAREIAMKSISKGIVSQRQVIGNAFRSDIDMQGRIILPPGLRKFAELTKDVVVVGAMTRIEIWDAARWDVYDEENGQDILSAFEELGI